MDDNRQVMIRVKVKSAGVIDIFNLLAYSDEYKSELLGNWAIEIHSLLGYV